MSRLKTFQDAFWGADYCSTNGFDALKKHIRDGRATCKTYVEHLKLRAKAEEEYGKALLRSCKLSPELVESGNTMRAAIDSLRTETEKMANVHTELANNLLSAATRLSDFVNQQRILLKTQEDAVQQAIRTKVSLYKSVQDAKKQYMQKSQDAETADIAYEKAQQEQSAFTTKEYDKIMQNARKTKNEAEKACKNYEDSISKLESARLEWDLAMSQFCDLCEKQELARMKMLQNEMWICCNMNSITCVEADEQSETIRQKLEKVDLCGDLQTFINTSGTGKERPAAIQFEEYRPQHSSYSPSSGSNSSGALQLNRPARSADGTGSGGGQYDVIGGSAWPHPRAVPVHGQNTGLANGQLPYSAAHPNSRTQAPVQFVNKNYH